MKHLTLIAATATATALAATGFADSHEEMPGEIVARHGQMQIMALNLGVIGNMARGNTDYDADAAQAAADNLVAISGVSQDLLWPDSTSDHPASHALPTVWTDRDGFFAAWDDFGEGAAQLQAVAGDGMDAMRAGLGAVGRTCGGCHDDYRMSDD